MNTARLILDGPARGSWNMAVDEALLRTAGDARTITLRVYRWSEPTLSLGYFQPYRAREMHAPSRQCAAVRRASGGGAIVHDQEITYSLTAPVRGRADQQLNQWYDLVHLAWVTALESWGIEAQRCPETDPRKEREFLCFQRRSTGDLLCGSAKIGGSAQRRHADAALQHGSLLLRRSQAAPELPGIWELTGRDLTGQAWLDGWIDLMGRNLNVSWAPSGLTDQEEERAAWLEQAKFAHRAWTGRR